MSDNKSIDKKMPQRAMPFVADSGSSDIDSVVHGAATVADTWAASSGEDRALLLRALAEKLESNRELVVGLADQETHLGLPRLNGELDRTTFQLRRFAYLTQQRVPFAHLDEPFTPGAPPSGHPALMRQRWPLGPVAMFAASNFPLAFSVLGGDTASALAAGCPVVVKAHPAHSQLSSCVFSLAQEAIRALSLPLELMGMVQGASPEVGLSLIRHPEIAAAAFTGSTQGGLALMAAAQARTVPIPFYGELGAVNPVVALPSALIAEGPALATALAASIAMGCGQFCTNPGVIVALDHSATDRFVANLARALHEQPLHAMLTAAMREAYDIKSQSLVQHGAQPLVSAPSSGTSPSAFLAEVDATRFIANPSLREEVFGPSSLIVRARDLPQIQKVLSTIGGSLTVTIWGAEVDSPDTRALVRSATKIAGRVLFKGVPTGVAVNAAQQHGGPYPASTAPMYTSVGDAAIERFLRPVAFQEAPDWLRSRDGQPF